jgi:DinB superfamily
MRVQDAVAELIDASRTNVFRYLAGFDESNRTKQAVNLPNHAAWNLGHCALTMHRVAEKLDGRGIPEADFLAGADRGDASCFGTESVSFGSVPKDESSAYPSLERGRAIFSSAADRLIAAVRAASEPKLSEVTPWGSMSMPLYLLAMRMATHNGMHTGQLADLRRALGFKSVFA